MSRQASFSDLEYANKKRQTRRELFLAEMEAVVPWPELLGVVEPHYPRVGGRGRPPVGLASMLRIYFLQQWFALSDRRVQLTARAVCRDPPAPGELRERTWDRAVPTGLAVKFFRLSAGGRWIRTSGSAPDKGSGPRFRFAPELMATDDGSRRIDGGMQPKPAIFALSRACIERGTGSSNPSPSSEESANFRSPSLFFSDTGFTPTFEVVAKCRGGIGNSTLSPSRVPSS